MRLTDYQRGRILDVIKRNFGETANVYLFGSRVDDHKKGGDIDLLVVMSGSIDDLEYLKIKSITGIQFAIGDQKIDMVVTPDISADQRLVVKEAIKTGILL